MLFEIPNFLIRFCSNYFLIGLSDFLLLLLKVSYFWSGLAFKGKDQFWSCDCIVKETVWNRPEKVDHLAYKNLCVLQGFGIIKMIRNLAKSW